MNNRTWRERFGLLSHRDFRLLFVGQTLSTLGDAAATIAVAFAVLGIGGSATALGVVLAARYVPLAGFLLVGGAFADRLPRRRLMLISDIVRAVSQALLGALVLSGAAQVWQIVVLQAIYGTAEAFFSPSIGGLVPQVVEPGRLQQGNALLRMSFSTSMIVGPALGGILVTFLGPEGAIVLDGASFAVSAMLIARLGSTYDKRSTPQPLRLVADLKEGWAEVRSRRWLSVSILNATFFNTLAIPAIVVLGPELANAELGGVGAWALLIAVRGAGALLGSVASLRVQVVRPAAAVAILLALAASQAAALASGMGLAVIAALCFGAGAAMAISGITWSSMIQQHVPEDALSRVDAMDDFATFLLMPLGYVMAGPLANAMGLHAAMALLTAVPVAVSLATLASRQVRELTWPEVAIA